MGKARTDSRGQTKEQQLSKENKSLKIELSRLRKLLARTELSGYENVKEVIEEFNKDSNLPSTQEILEALKQEWKCNKCEEGYLEIFKYTKVDSTWYYRVCSNSPSCKNRTKSQKYTSEVRGIIKGQ